METRRHGDASPRRQSAMATISAPIWDKDRMGIIEAVDKKFVMSRYGCSEWGGLSRQEQKLQSGGADEMTENGESAGYVKTSATVDRTVYGSQRRTELFFGDILRVARSRNSGKSFEGEKTFKIRK